MANCAGSRDSTNHCKLQKSRETITPNNQRVVLRMNKAKAKLTITVPNTEYYSTPQWGEF